MRTPLATRLFLPLALAASFWLGCSSTNEDPAEAGDPGPDGAVDGPAPIVDASADTTPAIDGGPLVIDGGIECHLQPGDDPVFVYGAPGCGAQQPAPICVGPVGACAQYACSCAGKVIIGCTVFFEPYAHTLCGGGSCALDAAPTAGAACDPNAH